MYKMPIDREVTQGSITRKTNKGKRLKRRKVVGFELSEQQIITNVKASFVIAIDPDADKKNGLSVVSRPLQKITHLLEFDAYDLCRYVGANFAKGDVVIYIEFPKNRKMWHGEIEGAENWSMDSRLANASSKGVDVGENRGVAKTIHCILTRMGYNPIYVEPLPKVNGKKINDPDFRKETGYDGPATNQEKRDAGLLAWRHR